MQEHENQFFILILYKIHKMLQFFYSLTLTIESYIFEKKLTN